MAERNRRGAQLSIELPPALLQRLKDRAKEQNATTAALVRRWIEAGLDGALSPTRHGSGALEVRLEALETAVAALQQQQSGPSRGSPKNGQPPLPQPAVEPRPKTQPIRPAAIPQTGDAPEGAITTAELATRTSTNRAGWNNWAKDHEIGEVRDHPEAGRWKLTGKAALESGGPPRWLWEPA